MTDFFFLSLIFIIAILYSSVGHGGASGYLALMALFNFSPEIIRPEALALNIFISAIAFYSFYKNNHFRFNLLWPFVITSIPFAFLGGFISVDPQIYKFILGGFLLFAIARMLHNPKINNAGMKKINIKLSLLIGAILGFLSGLIGIGGGIILSPIIILLGWANLKETSAVSAAFIFLNSISGFIGLVSQGANISNEIFAMLAAGILGGLIGSRLGSFHFTEKLLRQALSIVLIFASFKLLVL